MQNLYDSKGEDLLSLEMHHVSPPKGVNYRSHNGLYASSAQSKILNPKPQNTVLHLSNKDV